MFPMEVPRGRKAAATTIMEVAVDAETVVEVVAADATVNRDEEVAVERVGGRDEVERMLVAVTRRRS